MLRTTTQLMAAVLCCLLAGAALGEAAGPKMVVPEKIKDMGTVPRVRSWKSTS